MLQCCCRRASFSSVSSRFHARGAATENARSPNDAPSMETVASLGEGRGSGHPQLPPRVSPTIVTPLHGEVAVAGGTQGRAWLLCRRPVWAARGEDYSLCCLIAPPPKMYHVWDIKRSRDPSVCPSVRLSYVPRANKARARPMTALEHQQERNRVVFVGGEARELPPHWIW